jgi:hypothetical protein
MDFHNRQYDPQVCRFLSVDPLAAATAGMSSYTGMNNNPTSTVDPLGLTGIEIISWVDYAPTRMDQLLMMSPSELMDQLGMTDELRNYNEQMVAAAQAREQARETKQHAATQAWTGKVDRTVGSVKCNRFSSDRPTANEVYGVGGGTSDGEGAGDGNKGGKKEPMGPFEDSPNNSTETKSSQVSETEAAAAAISTANYAVDIVGNLSEQYGLYLASLALEKNGWRSSYSAPVNGWLMFGKSMGKVSTGLGVSSLILDGTQVSSGKMSGTRFAYHVGAFATSGYIGAQLGGPYGFGAGLGFAGLELAYDKVIQPKVIQPAVFQASWSTSSFFRTFFYGRR